jgi:hypothetical protein
VKSNCKGSDPAKQCREGSDPADQRTSGEVGEFGNGGVLGRVWPYGGYWEGSGPTAVSMALNVSERMFRSHSKSCR